MNAQTKLANYNSNFQLGLLGLAAVLPMLTAMILAIIARFEGQPRDGGLLLTFVGGLGIATYMTMGSVVQRIERLEGVLADRPDHLPLEAAQLPETVASGSGL